MALEARWPVRPLPSTGQDDLFMALSDPHADPARANAGTVARTGRAMAVADLLNPKIQKYCTSTYILHSVGT